MTPFKLIIDGSSARKHDVTILQDAVFNLQDTEDSYIILEPKTPIQNSIYLQAVKQEDVYIAEIRFIFGSEDNYKHYSRIFDNKEDLFRVFFKYYSECIIPNIKSWKDETQILDSETEDEMVKLYKTENGVIRYFEIWLNDDEVSLTIHSGILGDTGETEDIFYDEEGDLPVKVAMAKLVSSQKELGYVENVLTELIIQYSYNENSDMNALLEKRYRIESLLNECLGWTGNGHCDGGDIGSGSLNIFCYVVDKDIALRTILETFVEDGYIEGIRVAYADEQTEEYELLYPKEGNFNLI